MDGSGYGFAESVWSTGLVLLELATGCLPFPNHVYDELGSGLGGVITTDLLDRALDQAGSTAQFREFIQRCLIKNPNHRPSAQCILQDTFIRSHISPNAVALFGEVETDISIGIIAADTHAAGGNRVAPDLTSVSHAANNRASSAAAASSARARNLCVAKVVGVALVFAGGTALIVYASSSSRTAK